jgi:hypothetical protein
VIRYEVRLDADPSQAAAIESYMRDHHIAAVLATGCFVGARFERAESGTFRTTYVAATPGDLDRYMADHATRLRAEFMDRFPDGVTPTRELWNELQEWP